MSTLAQSAAAYTRDASRCVNDPSTAEDTYYPPLVNLWRALLVSRGLDLDVRANIKQSGGAAKGLDRPDLAIYDAAGEPVVLGEVKHPGVELDDLAVSVERNDQVGRYLARSNVVLLSNVRAVGLLVRKGGTSTPPGVPVPPGDRHLLRVVELWSSVADLRAGKPIPEATVAALADLLEHAFTDYAVLREPRALARVFARLARHALDDLPRTFDAVRPLLDDYRDGLGLTFDEARGEAFFRSSLVQTAFYGLFASWTVWAAEQRADVFDWRRVGEYLRVPFLGGLFHDFNHPARLKELRLGPHLDRASTLLRKIDRAAFFERFGAQTLDSELSKSDAALTYFYEPFLEAFDPRLREDLGVWYTPPAIVRYQVERIDQLLRAELGCPDGFADERVVVLDPCCGTGAYLLEVLRRIATTVRARGEEALVAAEVHRAITSRVIGFEILTAPFVVAHMQIAFFLANLGLAPKEDVRARVILTNALTGWREDADQKFNFPEIKAEHDLARAVKRSERIVVILGNPPYNAFAGAAMDEEADLVDHYKGVTRKAARAEAHGAVARKGGRKVMVATGESRLSRDWGVRKQRLDDLYVRFFRLAEERIGEHAEFGVASFISNASFLAGRSHPIMRESLLATFDRIWVDNMHGNRLARERTPSGESCETLFNVAESSGIKVGTAITTMVRRPVRSGPARVFVRDFWGRALAKRQALIDSLHMDAKTPEWLEAQAKTSEGPRPYTELSPTKASWFRFAGGASGVGYAEWPSLPELFGEWFQGIEPNRGLRDSLIDHDRGRLAQRMRLYFTSERLDEVTAALPELMAKRSRYEPEAVWNVLRKSSRFDEAQVTPYLLFPFDQRWIYYETGAKLLNERRPVFWDNRADNEFLLAVPQARRSSESRPLFARTLVDRHIHDRGCFAFPRTVRMGDLIKTPEANLREPAWKALSTAYGLQGTRGSPDAVALVGRLFRAALAVMHSPVYEADHAEALVHDWAHLPLPREVAALDVLVALGDRVATLLDPSADASGVVTELLGPDAPGRLARMDRTNGGTTPIEGEPLQYTYGASSPGRWVARPYRDDEPRDEAWGEDTGDVGIHDGFRFANVPREVWEYELGGYPVLKKWLGYRQQKDRGGEALGLPELRWFRQMVQRVAALLSLGPRLDAAYEASLSGAFTAAELGVRAAPVSVGVLP